MGRVVDIERVKLDRLADELLPAIRVAFAGQGVYRMSTVGIDDVARWRRAARACARELGLRCSTGVSADGSFVWIVDTSPATFQQQVRARRIMAELSR